MDERKIPLILLAVTALLAAFLIGLFVGRTAGGQSIYQSAVSTLPPAPSESEATGSPDATEEPLMEKININTADLQTLMTLTGIGETYAQRIIDYREANGPFQNIADITKVAGIGTKRFEAIKNDITVG